MRTSLRARFDAPSPLGLITYPIKNRMPLVTSGDKVVVIDTDRNL
jgi:hypothetical protein